METAAGSESTARSETEASWNLRVRAQAPSAPNHFYDVSSTVTNSDEAVDVDARAPERGLDLFR
jgi:hypothetical protein